MYWRNRAALIAAEKTVDGDGYKITNEMRRTVCVNKKSTTRSEFYTAKRAGDKIALVPEVPGADYHGEMRVEYEGQLYEVVRTYTRNSNKVQIELQTGRRAAGRNGRGGNGMSINRILKATLAPVAPVEADVYKGKKAFISRSMGHERVLIQAHLYASTGLNVLGKIRDIKKALSAAGMTWPDYVNVSDKDGQHHIFECEATRKQT